MAIEDLHKPAYFRLLHGQPISYNEAALEQPNTTALIRQLVNDGEAVGQFGFDQQGEIDLFVYRKGTCNEGVK